MNVAFKVDVKTLELRRRTAKMIGKTLAQNATLGLALAVAGASPCWADTAEVLPKGVSALRISYTGYRTIDERFDPDGRVEDIAADFHK